MGKFDISKIANAKWIGVAGAIITGVVAVASNLQDQKKEKTISDLVDRVSKLENK